MAVGATAGKMCGLTYNSISCTFRAGHDSGPEGTPHSWKWIKDQNDAERAEQRRRGTDLATVPSDVAAMVEAIRNGNADPYLEALLAVLHDRKRALRNVPGFPNLARR